MKRLLSRILYAALISTLAIGSMGQTPLVQAAPSGDTEIEFRFMTIPTNPICVGDKKEIDAYLHRKLQLSDPKYTAGLGGSWQAVPGIRIKAAVADPSIGQISPAQITTDVFGTADFIFLAERPGETTVTFEGTVVTPGWFGTNWGGDSISGIINHPIKVINCKYKVKTVLQFPVPELYNITVIGDDAVMTGDEVGAFTGSAAMYWVYSEVSQEDCDFSISASDSQVDLTGQLDEAGGQFVVTETFQPTTVAVSMCCPIVGCRSASEQGTVYPLTFNVASSGGIVTQTVSGQGVSGLAYIIVVPEEEEAVSFIPGDQEPSSDVFSDLFGALLALH